MKVLLRKTIHFLSNPFLFGFFLLVLCLAAYAPLLTKLGFYWDDFPISWIAATMGGQGLARYFSTNRPVWGLLYRLTTPLVGSQPAAWQIIGLLMRWVTGLLLWALLRLVWADRPTEGSQENASRRRFAAWGAALFVLYPGFSQQFIAFMYTHFYLVLSALLLSLCLMALALRLRTRLPRPWLGLLVIASLALGLLNLLSMEYFFLMDLLRPLLIWVILSEAVPNLRQRLKWTFLAWLPYLIVFAGAMYWRSVLFGFQTYQPALLARLKTQPLPAILQLIPTVLTDVWKVSVGAWAKAFTQPNALEIGAANMQRYSLLVAAGMIITLIYLLFYQSARRSSLRQGFKAWWRPQAWGWQPAFVGGLALFIAGGPFWLTDLKIGLVFPNDRFTLPFMLGTSLLAAALLVLLPLPHAAKAGLLAVGLGFAIGLQFQNAIDYNRDWSIQRTLFWELTWRMPGLQPGTALLSNELPVTHYTDNSLTAPLNWTFDPYNDPRVMNYALFYPTIRKAETLSNFATNQPIRLNYLATSFLGNTSQVVTVYFNPPGCLRVMDPQIEEYNWMVPAYLKESLALSSTTPILPVPRAGQAAARPPAAIYGAEIAHGWCYYFEKADLARQVGDWQTVAELGDEAFSANDYPNDPLERFPFIEGYAHMQLWSKALKLSQDANAVSPEVMQPMVCRLWQRIASQTPGSSEKTAALQTIQAGLECGLSTH